LESREQSRQLGKRSGLERRWIMSSLVPVIISLTLLAALVCVGLTTNYYSGARSTLRVKAESAADYFNTYMMTGYNDYYRSATAYVESVGTSDPVEVQFLSTMGEVEISTQAVMSGSRPGTGDIAEALSSGETGVYTGVATTGERVMAISTLLKYNGRVVGVMRHVTGIAGLDRQVMLTILATVAILMGVLILIILSSTLFITSVVAPVAAVSEAAKEISGGSYGIQIENRYSDEMGELVDNINDMSVKIGQNEKLRSEFVSSVSHELRTPLTAINGWGETLLGAGDDPETMKRGLNIIVKESARLTQMVEELLDFSRMNDGRFTLQMEEIDLQAEFEDAIYTYRELFRQDGIALMYESQDMEITPMSADPQRLKQVFCNVLDNARKHGGSGKRIEAALSRRGHRYYEITIRDFGPGIPKDELPHVKEKFYKGSYKARGSGIGLAVCDEIIRLHGGTFTIANARGGGTVVTIRLPIHGVAE